MSVATATEESILVHAWRAERLHRLGIPAVIADQLADSVDWHYVAGLVGRGCNPILALEIAL
jgi:hypothetical protein